LTGEAGAAEAALSAALVEVEPHLEGLRSASQRNAWLVQRIRKNCLPQAKGVAADGPVPAVPRLLREETLERIEILEIEAYIVARRLRALPEPDRSALALFYLDLLAPAESAKVLGQTFEEYCGVLGRARVALHGSLRADLATPAAPLA
jgi:DNA-directed RNA polymerase specialized sigma24 family protein